MNPFVPNKKLDYIAKHGLSLTFYCRCGDAIGNGNCPRCGRVNNLKRQRKNDKAKYLDGFKVKW